MWTGAADTIAIVQQKTGNPLTRAAACAGDGQARRLRARTSGPPRLMITCSFARVAPHTRLADHASVLQGDRRDVPPRREWPT